MAKLTPLVILLTAFWGAGCSQNSFLGETGKHGAGSSDGTPVPPHENGGLGTGADANAKLPNGVPEGNGKNDVNLGTQTGFRGEPQGLTVLGNETVAAPDLKQCAELPAKGKQSYGPGNPQCPEDQVMVIVNDGMAQERTCCPIGKNVLSSKPADTTHRFRTCGEDEVATGIVHADTSQGPELVCTKFNTSYLQLGAPVASIYAQGRNGSLSALMTKIAESYNIRDTCICPEGSMVHSRPRSKDDQCFDQCVKLIKKK